MFRSHSFGLFKKSLCLVLSICFLTTSTSSYAQSAFVSALPEPGTMVNVSPSFVPVLVKGLVIHPDKPLNFDFIVDSGNDSTDPAVIKEQTERMAKYFLAALTVPEDQLWVNLSPYEHDRMIEEELGQTVLGRDMLAQDYLLKQLTASLIYPEKDLGNEFWTKVYAEAEDKFGTTDIPVDTFNKVWIMPEVAEVFEHGAGNMGQGDPAVYVTKAKLKVMLDSDYEQKKGETSDVGRKTSEESTSNVSRQTSNQDSDQPSLPTQELSKQILREIIVPAIEREVNEGQNFALLRQIYHAAILAKWYRELIQDTLLSDAYVGKNKVSGVKTDDNAIKEGIYQRYIAAYKKGVFNIIKDEADSTSGETIPRKYFSGGEQLNNITLSHKGTALDASQATGSTYKVDFSMGHPINQKLTEPNNYYLNLETDNAVAEAYLNDLVITTPFNVRMNLDAAMVSEAWQWIQNHPLLTAGGVGGIMSSIQALRYLLENDISKKNVIGDTFISPFVWTLLIPFGSFFPVMIYDLFIGGAPILEPYPWLHGFNIYTFLMSGNLGYGVGSLLFRKIFDLNGMRRNESTTTSTITSKGYYRANPIVYTGQWSDAFSEDPDDYNPDGTMKVDRKPNDYAQSSYYHEFSSEMPASILSISIPDPATASVWAVNVPDVAMWNELGRVLTDPTLQVAGVVLAVGVLVFGVYKVWGRYSVSGNILRAEKNDPEAYVWLQRNHSLQAVKYLNEKREKLANDLLVAENAADYEQYNKISLILNSLGDERGAFYYFHVFKPAIQKGWVPDPEYSGWTDYDFHHASVHGAYIMATGHWESEDKPEVNYWERRMRSDSSMASVWADNVPDAAMVAETVEWVLNHPVLAAVGVTTIGLLSLRDFIVEWIQCHTLAGAKYRNSVYTWKNLFKYRPKLLLRYREEAIVYLLDKPDDDESLGRLFISWGAREDQIMQGYKSDFLRCLYPEVIKEAVAFVERREFTLGAVMKKIIESAPGFSKCKYENRKIVFEKALEYVQKGYDFFVIYTSGYYEHFPNGRIDYMPVGYGSQEHGDPVEGYDSHWVFPKVDIVKQDKTPNGNIDKAMNGGIDIHNIDVNKKSSGQKIHFNDAAMKAILDGGFEGFTPVFIRMEQVASHLMILGLGAQDVEPVNQSSSDSRELSLMPVKEPESGESFAG